MANEDLLQKIYDMQALQAEIEEKDAVIKQLRKEYDQLRLFDIPNMMAEMDLTSFKGTWGRCTLTGDLHVSVKDKVGLHEWLKDGGNGSLIVPTVNAQTLKAFCKEQMVNGTELPEKILNISPFTRAVLYKK